MNKVIKNINQLQEQCEDILGNFHEGETVWIDRGRVNEQLVTIIQFGKRFCKVKNESGEKWETMIYRLTKP